MPPPPETTTPNAERTAVRRFKHAEVAWGYVWCVDPATEELPGDRPLMNQCFDADLKE